MKLLIKFLSLSLICMSSVNASESHVMHKDIAYKQVEGKAIGLDLYTPSAQADQPYPLLVWVHGGAWKRGSKDAIPTKNPTLLNAVLEKGYALAAVNYRLSGEAIFPAPLTDINDALNYLHDHANQYHIRADELAMMGRSAGGHLAGLVGATNSHSNIAFYTSNPKYRVKAVVSFFGPTDLMALGKKHGKKASKRSSVARFLGDIPSNIPDIAQRASTTHYINSNTPPFIQLHGAEDKRVPVSQSQLLQSKLDDYGIDNQLFIEQGVGHSAAVFDTDKYVPHVMAFLEQHFPAQR
ncbi:alpha/beta hydrolase [Salinivibrio sp. KP-1]|uniref:alpha/beta hydrolase n=1 Tax=Salinivibrio sp. KP-1 TaxID=1406902 RepID=UPI0006148B46|nr:alpha/beta hydrolase [Salinivibrio sp. KP-1]KKA46214.1 lipase [Salinivibrio sp. KP-1]